MQTQSSPNGAYLIGITLVATLGGLLFGYDTGVINGTQYFFSQYFDLSPAMKGLTVSSALLGCLVGALVAGPLSDRLGRKASLILSAILFTVSAYGSGLPDFLPQTVEALLIFRVIGGLGIGVASMCAPMYVAELAPADKRGNLVTYYQLAIVIGFFVVFLVTYFIGQNYTEEQNIARGWREMFWSELIPCVLFLVMLFLVPRSPRWLMLKGKEEEAMKVLVKVHGIDLARKELQEIQTSIRAEQAKERASIFTKSLLPVVLIGTVLSILQQTTGINAVLYYGADIFEKALGFGKDEVLLQQLILAGVNFAFTFLAMFTVDSLGRKPLIMIGSFGMLAGFLILGGTLLSQQVGFLSLVGVLLFIASFAMSMGPVTWVLLSEIFPNNIRSQAMSIAVAAQWGANYLVSQAFPIVAESQVNTSSWNGSLPYFIFAAFIAGLVLFTWKFIPETKGKSLEDMNKLWQEKYG